MEFLSSHELITVGCCGLIGLLAYLQKSFGFTLKRIKFGKDNSHTEFFVQVSIKNKG